MKDGILLYEAFRNLIKTLATKDFPSGQGNWRNELKYRSDELTSKTQDDPDLYSVESLLELSDEAPFKKNTDWSDDAKDIIEASTIDPRNIDQNNIEKYFTKLRIIDQNVQEIDEQIKKFTNLQELTLSANSINSVNGNYLPRSLKVLQLVGNQLCDIGDLACNPPALNHLGLSYNLIYGIEESLKPQLWESLLSLDLSYNYIHNLKSTINTLKLLPKLRSLLLKGNPVFYFVGYQGYTIDSLPSLTILDDKHITVDDRYYNKDFSKIKDLQIKPVILEITINDLKGFTPGDQQNSNSDEYPQNLIKYHLELEFVNDFEIKEQDFFQTTFMEEPQNENIVTITADSQHKSLPDNSGESIIKTPEVAVSEDGQLLIDFHKLVLSNDLVQFHKYLKSNAKLKLVANHVLMGNIPKPENGDLSLLTLEKPSLAGKEKSGKPVSRANSKLSNAKMSTQEAAKPKPKGKGKQDIELFEWSRDSTVYANCEMNFQKMFEDGEDINKQVVLDIQKFSSIYQTFESHNQNNGKKLLDPKKKTTKDLRKSSIEISSAKSKNRKQKENTKDIPEESESIPPLPLSVQFTMRLLRWESSKQAFNESKQLGMKRINPL